MAPRSRTSRARRASVAAALVWALAGCGDEGRDDAGAVEAMVLETCAPGAAPDPVQQQVCECAYEELLDRLGAEGLERLDRDLRDDPETVPVEVQEVVLDCTFELVAPPTTKPPVASSTSSTSATSSTSTSSPSAP